MDGRQARHGTAGRRTPTARRRDLRWVPVAIVVWTASLVAAPASVLAYQAAQGPEAAAETEVAPAAVRQDRTPGDAPAYPADPAAPLDPTAVEDPTPGLSAVVQTTAAGDASAPEDAPPVAPDVATDELPSTPATTETLSSAPPTASAASAPLVDEPTQDAAAVTTESAAPTG